MAMTRNHKAFNLYVAGAPSLKEAFNTVDRREARRGLLNIERACSELEASCGGRWNDAAHSRYRDEVVTLLTCVKQGVLSRKGFQIGLCNTNTNMCEAGVDPFVRSAITAWGVAFLFS